MTQATVDSDLKNDIEKVASGYVPGYAKFQRNLITMGTATARTLRAIEDSGAVVLALTDNTVITLPEAATCPGMQVTVVNVGADGAAKVSISPNEADKIKGSIAGVTGAGAATVVASGAVADKDWINTKSTANNGDWCTLVSDGVDSWYIVGGIGEWASEG